MESNSNNLFSWGWYYKSYICPDLILECNKDTPDYLYDIKFNGNEYIPEKIMSNIFVRDYNTLRGVKYKNFYMSEIWNYVNDANPLSYPFINYTDLITFYKTFNFCLFKKYENCKKMCEIMNENYQNYQVESYRQHVLYSHIDND
jgi:hypothetical protein